MSRFLATLFVGIILLGRGVAQAEDAAVKSFILENGLQVVIIENHKAPIVKQMLFYKVGSADEASGEGGLAHLLEHLMFRGTSLVPGQQFNRIMEENGAESNAFTAQDVTAYHQFLDISRLELAMFLEADRMNGLNVSTTDFTTEQNIVYQERQQRVRNNPASSFGEKVRKALWQEHPFAHPITGEDNDIANLTENSMDAFYRHFYAPNNAVLVLSGDIDMETAQRLAQKYYGFIKPAILKQTIFPELPPDYKATVEMSLPKVRMGRWIKQVAAPSVVREPAKIYALEILAEYMAGDDNAPLYQDLVVKTGKALAVSVDYDALSRSYGTFSLSAIPAGLPDDSFAKTINQAWNQALKQFNEDALTKTKHKLLVDLAYLKDNPSSLAGLIGNLLAVGGSLENWQMYEQRINRVTVADVLAMADEIWNKSPQVVGALYPEGEQQ
jgi:zinc protease